MEIVGAIISRSEVALRFEQTGSTMQDMELLFVNALCGTSATVRSLTGDIDEAADFDRCIPAQFHLVKRKYSGSGLGGRKHWS